MQFAILISVLVALLLSAFLLLTHVQSFFRIKSKEIIEVFEESNKQLFVSLDIANQPTDTISTTIDYKTIKQIKKYQGAWLKQYVEVGIHNRKAVKVAYTGSERSEKTPNLYVEDTNSPIVVVGDTRLEGNSYLPKQGVKAGNISGNYYQGTNLYYGKVIESKISLPRLEPKWIEYLESISQGDFLDISNVIPLQKELKNSFVNPVQVVYSPEPVFLEENEITGNIIIQSLTKIVVRPESKLKDVLLIAPEIIISDDAKGAFQCIATKNISVGKRCHLFYPSSIILLDKKKLQKKDQNNQYQQAHPDIMIDKGTVIEGTIVYLNKTRDQISRIKTNLEIGTDIKIVGEVYCQGNIDFQGSVFGSLYTHQFIARQFGSVYLNHIYNGKVIQNPIVGYSGLPFLDTKNTIAKWLY